MCTFYIDVRDEQTGNVVNWALEMGAPAVIQRNGWTRNTMKIGDLVIVTGLAGQKWETPRQCAHSNDGQHRPAAGSGLE